jgi:putative PIN family toxin of toxin-antitoxin system
MSNVARVVFDSNVFISALLFESSTPGPAVLRALDAGKLLISQELILELQCVLGRSKFDRYLDREDRDLFLELLVLHGELVTVTNCVQLCRDARDDHLLSLATDGNADYLVTGDKDLLVLKKFARAEIVAPADFLLSPLEDVD